jgi:beta-glucosidase
MKSYPIYLFALIFVLSFVQDGCTTSKLTTKTYTISELDRKVDSVLSMMTLEEKIGQMVQYNGSWDVTGPASSKNDQMKEQKIKTGGVGSMLNIVSVKATREAQKLCMEHSRLKIPLIFGYDVIHGYKTIFPVPLGATSSWDMDLIQKAASIAAIETSASGVQWTFSPMVDVSRDARWGRIMEGSGEDPYLISQVAIAHIKGYQGKDLSDAHTIAACAKHFAGYGFGESGKDYNTVQLGENELRNTVLPPFKACVDAGVASFMNSFNDIDGIPSTGSKLLQRTILKGEWQFDGMVVSDWGSIGELVPHGYASDKKEAAYISIQAGSDMDMESYAYEDYLKPLLEEGKIDEALIDDAVKRILKLKFRLGLFDNPYLYCDEKREKESIYTQEHLDFSREVAKKSIVLLKNEKQLLPLSKEISSIAVIGPLAANKDAALGNWRAQAIPNSAVSVLEGIQQIVSKNTVVHYAKGCELTIDYLKPDESRFLFPLKFNESDTSGFSEAIEIAQKSEVVLLVLGEDAYQTGEGRSQADVGLKGVQSELFNAIQKVNPNIVLVLMNGRPLEIKEEAALSPAILETWLLGSQAGNAVADVLFGDYNPSGKLPVSFPQSTGQEPLYYNHKNTGRPYNATHVTFAAFRDVSNEALFPFGFGLSYTTFSYSDFILSQTDFQRGKSITATVTVTNTGNRYGDEVVQWYIKDKVASLTRPIIELKGFEKIGLEPGTSKKVTFLIDESTLAFYTAQKNWEAELGDFEVMVGGNSVHLLKKSFTLKP